MQGRLQGRPTWQWAGEYTGKPAHGAVSLLSMTRTGGWNFTGARLFRCNSLSACAAAF
jgi:hypothetical protein